MPPDDVDWPDDDWIVKNDMKSRSAVTDDFPSDSDIERAAVEVLRARMPFQQDPIRVTVENGQVSLEGFVAWHHQKAVAEEAVRALPGVTGVLNHISPKPQVLRSVIKAQIDNAFAHRGRLGARAISVEAANGEVTLKGSVRTLEEKELAEATARTAAGVTNLTSALTVESATARAGPSQQLPEDAIRKGQRWERAP